MTQLKIIKVNRIIPLYGNKNIFPYGKITFINNKGDHISCYFDDFKGIHNRKCYKLDHIGDLYSNNYRLFYLNKKERG